MTIEWARYTIGLCELNFKKRLDRTRTQARNIYKFLIDSVTKHCTLLALRNATYTCTQAYQHMKSELIVLVFPSCSHNS